MASATTITPHPRRGPLSHIVDALRLDNRQLLLETLRRDPRLGDDDEDYCDADDHRRDDEGTGGPDSAAGALLIGGQNNHAAAPAGTGDPSAVVADQQLVFGSADLRRVVLRHVMHDVRSSKDKKKGGGGKKGNKNATREAEEEGIVRDWNEELERSSRRGGGGDRRVTRIVGTKILSPSGDGTVICPYGNDSGATTPAAVKGGKSAARSFNPFGDDGDDDSDDENDVPITTYVLRGGGFDLPSLSAAALHRRRSLSKSRSRGAVGGGGRFRQPPPPPPKQRRSERMFRFVFVPRMTEMERAFLGELGVEDDASSDGALFGSRAPSSSSSGAIPTVAGSSNSLESLPIDLIPLDDDVLSLELSGGSGTSSTATGAVTEGDKGGGSSFSPPASAACMRHSNIEGCEADVADVVARSLLKLQLLNGSSGTGGSSSPRGGAIGRVQGLGPLATAVIDRMMTLRLEEERMDAQADDEEEEEDHDGDEIGEQKTDSYDGMDQDEVVNAADGVEITAHNKDAHRQDVGVGGNDTDELPAPPSIQALLVIDRKIDLVTPMLTPLTYEGLIDDVLQIQVGGCVTVKKSIVEPDDDDDDNVGGLRQHHPTMRSAAPDDGRDPTVLLPLNDSDPLYTEVRDRHVETFGSFLQNQAKALKESHSQFTNRETARDLTEIHQFVKQIPVFTRNLRSLTNHIHVAELVKSAAEASGFRQRWQTERSMLESEPCYEALEDLIASGEPPYRWLRLFCLQSLTSNGIKATRYDSLRREVVQTYGYEFLIVLNDLEKAGFLRKRETFFMDSMATSYSTLRKALNLINADVDPSDPGDPSYVSSGYAPMTVRWIQASMRGYAGLDEAMKELPAAGGVGVGSGGGGGGRWVDVEQRWPAESLVEALRRKRGPSLGALAKKWSEENSRAAIGGDNGDDGSSSTEKPVMLVYFVGGVTFMELAALRFLSRRPSFPYNIVCCTTEIVNGGTLLRSLSC